MAAIQRNIDSSKTSTPEMGQFVDALMRAADNSRKGFERRWYDNNFFDDGHHFRYLSRSTNKIVDLSEKSNLYSPMRAIPKASRQIRGVANLLVSNDPTPVVYPEKINRLALNQQEQEIALKLSKEFAKKCGFWLQNEFKEQGLVEKIALMVILAAKHGVSYLQVWPDPVMEAIKTQVYDAFDIYLMGTLTEIYDSPFIIKATPLLISQIKANEHFNKEQLLKINPDNKQASSEIKEAYMKARFGTEPGSDQAATLILKEAFLKEYLNEENMQRISKQEDAGLVLKGKKIGDPIIRQVFVAGNVWLRDVYTTLPDYPFVDFRFEPGPIYQVPLIERFIPSNKSLDTIVSRIERYSHTMVSGIWLKRQGETFKVNNAAGGQVIEYTSVPPQQANIASIPPFVFNFIALLNSFIEEQGVTTSAMGKLPKGVKANSAIESLKESEFASLVIASRRLNQTVKRTAEKMLDIADNNFITPQTVYFLEKGEPKYFDVIGNSALEQRNKLKVPTEEGVIPLKKDYHVDIEIESGLGYTKEGQKATMKALIAEVLLPLTTAGYIAPDAVKVVVERLLEVYGFGATGEFMEAMNNFEGMGNLAEKQVDGIKVAVMEVMKDLIKNGILPDEDQRIMENKVGFVEAMKDSGSLKPQEQPEKGPSKSISFKDLPPDGKAQLAAQAGIQLDPNQLAAQEAADAAQTVIRDQGQQV